MIELSKEHINGKKTYNQVQEEITSYYKKNQDNSADDEEEADEVATAIYEILNNQTDYHDGGYYKVGVDIPAGQYVLESYGSGYWAVMTGPVGSSDIVDNDN